MFTSLTLRTKLYMIVGVPLLVLGTVAAFAFLQARNLADDAAQQVERVEQALALEQLTATLQTELEASLDADGSAERLDAARSATDSQWNDVFGLMGDADQAELDIKQSELLGLREVFGNDPVVTQNLISLEILGQAPEPLLTLRGTQSFQTLITEIAQLDPLSGDDFTDGQTVLDIVVLKNLALWEGALGAEKNAFQLYLQPDIPPAVVQAGLLGPNAAAAQAQEHFLNLTPARHQRIVDRLAETPAVLALDRVREINRSGSTEARSTLEVSSATAGVDESLAAIAGERGDLQQNVVASTNRTAADARMFERGVLLGGIGILLVVSLVTLLLARSITHPLKSLARRSREIASEDVPAAVELFRTNGARVEVPQIEPLALASNDDLGELVGAFNQLHTTAIELASQQDQPRSVAAAVYVNLGRRNQRMLGRLLEEMNELGRDLERDKIDGGRISRLHSVDRMVTRMRRNAESLLVLAGSRPPRGWEEPADISAVIRDALAEVDGTERVDVQVEDPLRIDGEAVADVVHILAELIENALTFSPATTRVRVGLRLTSTESLVYVADEGLGLQGDALVAANSRILAAGQQEETPSEKLGLYAVGRLAARHGLTAGLVEETIGGGIVARVELGPVTLRKKRSKVASAEPDARPGTATSATSHGSLPSEPALPTSDTPALATPDVETSSDPLVSSTVPVDQVPGDEALMPKELAGAASVPESLRAPQYRKRGTGSMPIMPNAVPARLEVEDSDPPSTLPVPDDSSEVTNLRILSDQSLPHDEPEEPLTAVAADQFAAEFEAIAKIEATAAETAPSGAPLSYRLDPIEALDLPSSVADYATDDYATDDYATDDYATDDAEPDSPEVFDPYAIEATFTGFQSSTRPFDQAAFPDDDEDESSAYGSEYSWDLQTSLWSDAPETERLQLRSVPD